MSKITLLLIAFALGQPQPEKAAMIIAVGTTCAHDDAEYCFRLTFSPRADYVAFCLSNPEANSGKKVIHSWPAFSLISECQLTGHPLSVCFLRDGKTVVAGCHNRKDDVHRSIKALESDDDEIRINAARALNSLGKKAQSVVTNMVEAYAREQNGSVYIELEQALKKNGQTSADA